MNLSLALAVWVALSAPPTQQPETLLKKYIPRPTGANAFEEYLAAADVTRPRGLSEYEGFVALRGRFSPSGVARNRGEEFPFVPPGLKPESTSLDARREILRRYGKAVDLIHLGNSKPAVPFRTSLDVDTAIDELAGYRSVGKVMDSAAQVAFVDGNSGRATEVLLDMIFFGRAIGGETIIHYLVGTAVSAVALSRFEQNLGRLSVRDTDRIIRAMDDTLARTDPVILAMEGEKRSMIASAKQFTDPSTYEQDQDFDTEFERKHYETFQAFLRTMSAAEREAAQAKIIERVTASANRVIQVLKGPDNQWVTLPDAPQSAPIVEVKTLDQFVSSASEQIQPVYRQMIFASVKLRAQFRLLRLHAMILRFKMEFERLPDNLAECCPAADLDDPLSSKPFQYEIRDPSTYKLYSLGVPGVGEIELRYRRQSESSDAPIPPTP